MPLRFVQVNDPTGGLGEGAADVAVIRRPLTDPRFTTAQIGLEARYAAVSTDNALARRRSVRLADLAPPRPTCSRPTLRRPPSGGRTAWRTGSPTSR